MSNKANYRKHNDRSQNSSTYHKKDGTNVRSKLKVEAAKEIKYEKTEKEELDLAKRLRVNRGLLLPPGKWKNKRINEIAQRQKELMEEFERLDDELLNMEDPE